MNRNEFAYPGAAYRGVALWMLNDRLELDEIARQFEGIAAAGWGAVIARTFNGLLTEYLSDEWMRIMDKIVSLARDKGMKVWLQAGYMPSAVPGLTPESAHRMLVPKPKGEPLDEGETVLAEDDKHAYCEKLMPTVLDLLNPPAVREYLDGAYQHTWGDRFGDEFGRTVEAVWVDEPHFRPPPLPWSSKLTKTFREQWGYAITEHIPSLFAPVGDYQKVRHHYWRTVLAMFLEAYFAGVGEWCEQHNVKFTGHLMGEDTLKYQVGWTGACMPAYEYMHVPGIDHLTGDLCWPARKRFILTPKQCSSAAHQLGRPEVLAEMYGVSSHAISFQDRKRIAEWMFVLGVNYRCYHGAFYSMRGRRKRIYVPHLSYQQPWWPDNHLIADYFARLSYAMRQGRYIADVLVLHPVESVFCLYEPTWAGNPHDRSDESGRPREMDDHLVRLLDNLMKTHRGFDLGDETMLARHGRAGADGLRVGQMTYKAVVLPTLVTIRGTTLELLKRFAAAGGKVFSCGELPDRIDGAEDERAAELAKIAEPVDDEPGRLGAALEQAAPAEIELVSVSGGSAESIWVHGRQLDGGRAWFLTNTSRHETIEAQVKLRGAGRLERWDLTAGQVSAVPQRQEGEFTVTELSFAPLASHLLVLTDGKPPTVTAASPTAVAHSVELPDQWRVTRHAPNALTLDVCRFRKAVGEWSEPTPVVAVQQLLEAQDYHGPVALGFSFDVQAAPKRLFVVIEDAAQYQILVNGREAAYADLPYYMDRSFHPVEISALVQPGANTIELRRQFDPVPKASFALASLYEVHEGVELESIYLVGDFAVGGAAVDDADAPKCVRYRPAFKLAEEPGATAGNLSADGYPFFAGRATIAQTVRLDRPARDQRVVLELPTLDAAMAHVRVNGADAGSILWAPYELDVTPHVTDGENEIEVELVGTLRNLLGPHHRSTGEPDHCWRTAFNYNPHPERLEHAEERETAWTDDYFVVHFGIRGRARIKYFVPSGAEGLAAAE